MKRAPVDGVDLAALYASWEGETDRHPTPEPEVQETWLKPARIMTMTPLEPRTAGNLKGFGLTISFEDAPQVIPIRKPVSEPKAEDRTKPHPDCLDPAECGLSSWEWFCGRCKKAPEAKRAGAAA